MEQRSPRWTYLASLLLFVVGLDAGIGFPDIDQRLPFLLHRSLLTHGILLPLALFIIFRRTEHPAPRLFAMGFCLASTVHLCFDLFPRAWRGFALIWVPLYGRTSALFSEIWIGLGCVICVYLALLLIKHVLEILLSGVGLGATFFLNHASERSAVLALMALVVAAAIALALPSQARTLVRAATTEP